MQVDLFVSARKLKNLDTFSKSDPMCYLYEKQGKRWAKLGQTEQIKNDINPEFRKSFTIPYFFEKVQTLKFLMIDGDGTGDYDTIGEVVVTMGNLMGASKQMWTGNLEWEYNMNRGQIIVRTEAVQTSSEAVRLQPKVMNPNNETAGFLGCCTETFPYRFEILK